MLRILKIYTKNVFLEEFLPCVSIEQFVGFLQPLVCYFDMRWAFLIAQMNVIALPDCNNVQINCNSTSLRRLKKSMQ